MSESPLLSARAWGKARTGAGREIPRRVIQFQPSRPVATEKVSSGVNQKKRMLLLPQKGITASVFTQGIYSKPVEQKGSAGRGGERFADQDRTAYSLETKCRKRAQSRVSS